MSAFKAKQSFRLVIGCIFLVIGLIDLEDTAENPQAKSGALVASIALTGVGLIFLLKYYSDKRRRRPKGQ
jgi:hypothetical protein